MAKAYWMTFYREIKDPAKMAAYSQLAGPAIAAGGGTFLVRGVPEHIFEAGQKERTVVIVFNSMEEAVATHNSEAYRSALKALDGAAVRDMRFVAGA